MDAKSFSRVEIKDAAKGEVSAVFSTFGVVDSDGDVTLPDAFDGNTEVPISSYGHGSWGGGVPVGKGRIRTTSTEAVLDGKFFLDTASGHDTFTAVKELGEMGQWSYGYDPVESERGTFEGKDVRFLKRLKVHEVSPVLVGAGVATRTVSAKSRNGDKAADVSYKAAIRPHSAQTTARAWNAAAVVAAIDDGASVSDLRGVHAWVDSSGDPEAKGSYRFPHHHGAAGPANLRACTAGIAALNGARGGTTIPEADRKGVWNHLAAHLRDADREPPELRSGAQGPLKNIDRLPGLLDELGEVIGMIREVGSSRATRGKSLSSLTFEVLGWAEEDLVTVLTDLRALKNTPRENAAAEHVRFLAQRFKEKQP